jgi:hypothetical protein
LDNNEKETLDEDINLDEISKVIKILKPNKSPGEDGRVKIKLLIHYRVNVILVIPSVVLMELKSKHKQIQSHGFFKGEVTDKFKF